MLFRMLCPSCHVFCVIVVVWSPHTNKMCAKIMLYLLKKKITGIAYDVKMYIQQRVFRVLEEQAALEQDEHRPKAD